MRILIRADGSHKRGLGHIAKQILLYNKLKSLKHDVLFLTRQNKIVTSILAKHKVRFDEFSGPPLYYPYGHLKSYKPDVVILDILQTSSPYIERLKHHRVNKIVTFDNTDISAFSCDLIFNVMYYHDKEIKKGMDTSILYEGYSYILMSEAYKNVGHLCRPQAKKILLTQGGADTTAKTTILMKLLADIYRSKRHDFEVDVVLGPAFLKNNIKSIQDLGAKDKIFNLHRCPEGLADLMSVCDTVITAGGTTSWEAAACKRPMYIMANEAFEDETAGLHRKLGLALYDGWSPGETTIKESLLNLIFNSDLRHGMTSAMARYDMVNGLTRVIDKLYDHRVLQ